MSPMTSLMDYRVITVSEAEQRFEVSADIQYPYQDLAAEQEIRLYEGGLSVEGTMEPESDDQSSLDRLHTAFPRLRAEVR